MSTIENVKNQATGFLSNQVDQRTTDLGNMVGDHVNNLKSMSDSLRDQGQTQTASLIDMAAGRLDQVSQYLRNADGNTLMHDVESIARRQPFVTATVGLVAGFLAARMLKAGSSQRYRDYVEDGSTYGTQSTGTSTYGSTSYGSGANATSSYGDMTSSYETSATGVGTSDPLYES